MPVLYGSNVADSSLTTACDMADTSGGSETSSVTTAANSGTWLELVSQGGTVTASGITVPAPTGNGWLYNPGAGTFDANNWSFAANLSSGGTINGDLRVRFYTYVGGVYTAIGSIDLTSQTLTTTKTLYSFAATSMPLTTMASGDLIYLDLWLKDPGGTGGDVVTVYLSNSSTAGVANDVQATTSTFTPAPIDNIYYGLTTVDTTLATACDMATVTGGTETTVTTFTTGPNTFVEMYSKGNASAATFTSIPAPTGNGWVAKPGAGTFANDTWTANIALASAGYGAGSTYTVRFYRYSSGVYTAIGSITSGNATVLTRTVYTFAATIMPAITFAASDLLYIDLWLNDPTGVNGDAPVVYVSSTSTGVANDMQVATSLFTPAGSPARPTGEVRPRWVMRAITGGIFQPFIPIQAWVERGLTASFVRPTSPVNIPRYVRRSLTNVLLNYGLNISTRFRLMSANQLKDIATRFRLAIVKDISTRFILISGSTQSVRDIASRFRLMSANQLKDVATRFRLKSADQLKDIQSRFRLMSANQLKDIVTRFRLKSADQLKDIVTRFRLKSADQQKDVASRFRLMSANQLKDIVTRFRLKSADQLKDITTRFILVTPGQRLKDITSRFRLKSTDQLKDITSRFRLKSADQLKDIQSRFRLMSANQLKDIVSRFRLMSANQVKDVASRFRLRSANQLKDIQSRLRVMSANQLKDISTRLRLKSANQLKDIASRFILHGVGAFSNRDISTRFVLIVPSNAIWITRDGRISWLTRDDKAAWDTRDDLAAWKTR